MHRVLQYVAHTTFESVSANVTINADGRATE